jgi:ADP-ribose pyrophosphatase
MEISEGEFKPRPKSMKDLEERTLESECVFAGDLLRVYRDEIRRPDGGRSVREWLEHNGASAVIPLLPDGSVVLVRQFRYPPRMEFLELPAGKLDAPNEDPEAVARRELEEETGCRAGRIVRLGSFYPCIGYSNEIIHFFLADGLETGPQRLDESEFLEVITMPFAEAVALARDGKVADMKTAFGLMLAAARIEEDEDGLNIK